MVFGIDAIGRFFDSIGTFFVSSWYIIIVIGAFVVFVLLNAGFIFLYYRVISTAPTLIGKVKFLVNKVDEWLD